MKKKLFSIFLSFTIIFGTIFSVQFMNVTVNAADSDIMYEIDFDDTKVTINKGDSGFSTSMVSVESGDSVQSKYIQAKGYATDGANRAYAIKYDGEHIQLPAGRYKIDYKFKYKTIANKSLFTPYFVYNLNNHGDYKILKKLPQKSGYFGGVWTSDSFEVTLAENATSFGFGSSYKAGSADAAFMVDEIIITYLDNVLSFNMSSTAKKPDATVNMLGGAITEKGVITENGNAFMRLTEQSSNRHFILHTEYQEGNTKSGILATYVGGAPYRVSFRYRNVSAIDDVDTYIAFGVERTPYRCSNSSLENIYLNTIGKNETDWSEFTSGIITAPENTDKSLYIGFGLYGQTSYIGASTVDIDDVRIIPVANNTVIYNQNNSEGNIEQLATEAVPTPTAPPNMHFGGWYSDSACTQKVEDTAIAAISNVTNLYALWVPNGDKAINVGANGDYKVINNNASVIVNENVNNSSSELQAFKNSVENVSGNKTITLANTGESVAVKENSSYTISLDANENITISATDDAALIGGMNRFVDWISNGVVKLSKNFSYTQKFVASDSEYSLVWNDEFTGDFDKSIWGNYTNPDRKGGYEVKHNNKYYTYNATTSEYKEGYNYNLLTDVESTTSKYGRHLVRSEGVNTDGNSAVIKSEYLGFDETNEVPNIYTQEITSTGLEWLYGCVEIRAKWPVNMAEPSIWFTSATEVVDDVSYGMELDLAEPLANGDTDKNFKSNIHASSLQKSYDDYFGNVDERNYSSKTSLNNEYHIFSFYWTENEIKFAVDGTVFHTYDINSGVFGKEAAKNFHQKMNRIIIANALATGPEYKTGYFYDTSCGITEFEFLIDYVRLYQRNSDNGSLSVKGRSVSEIYNSANTYYRKVEQVYKLADYEVKIGGTTDSTIQETIRFNKGDILPKNFTTYGATAFADDNTRFSKYITHWTLNGNKVTRYSNVGGDYKPEYVDSVMLKTRYQMTEPESDKRNVRFIGSVNNLSDYKEVGFVFSKTDSDPTIGKVGVSSKNSKTVYEKIYENGVLVDKKYLVSEGKYTEYSNYFFTVEIKNIPKSTAEVSNSMYIRSYVKLNDGTIIYGNVELFSWTD